MEFDKNRFKRVDETHEINYKSKVGCVEMHVSIRTPVESSTSLINIEMADAMMTAIQNQAELTNRYDDPINIPIVLN